MTSSNIIIRSCATLIIVLSIMLAGGAPSGGSQTRIIESTVDECQINFETSSYDTEIC